MNVRNSKSLRSYVSMITALPTPAAIFWGRRYRQLYNAGYAEILGPRHPPSVGATFETSWPQTYPTMRPWLDDAMRGQARTVENSLLALTRRGFVEEAYFTFSLSPLFDDDGTIGGVYQPITETTQAVLHERRVRTLRALAARGVASAGSEAEVLATNAADIPFALIYSWEPDAALALVGHAGFEDGAPGGTLEHLVRRAIDSQSAFTIDDLAAVLPRPHVGCWPEPTREAYVVPLRRSAREAACGVAVLGISPRLRFDEQYREFFESIARELAANLAGTHAQRVEHDLRSREREARAEIELRKQHLASLLTQVPTPEMVLRGRDLVVELANLHACRLWAREERELLDQPLLEVLTELQGGELVAAIERTFDTGVVVQISEVTLDVPRATGPARVYFNFALAPMRNLDGVIERVMVVGFDVTEQVDARDQIEALRNEAERANRAKDEFLAILGHELRNPLAPILTAVEVMRLRGDGGLENERAVIERQCRHMVRLVDDLLDVSRITRGKIELERTPVELAGVVAQAIELASPLVERREHDLRVAVPRGLVVDVDPGRLAQAIANLVTNAAKYTPPGGRISVTARRDQQQIVLAVRDTGVGIEPAMLPRLFDVFVQAHQGADRTEGGLGLGLSIVRNIVQLHGGDVEARSEGRDRGSELVMRLPAVDREVVRALPSARTRAPTLPPIAGAGHCILVVDDNDDAAEMLALSLEALGHRTRVAHDGPAALRVVDELKPDIALLDIGLPAMDGYELARRLRNLPGLEQLPLVAVTGYGQRSDRSRSRAAGFDAHLVKPVSIAKVQQLVDQLLAPPRQ